MRKVFKWTAGLLAVLMLSGCGQKAAKEAPELLEPVGVQASDTAAAYIGEIYRSEVISGSIKPYVESLSFKVSGQVMEVNGYPGQMVEEGDMLIELDQVTLKERAEQVREDINYTEVDGGYSDAISDLDIKILETELRQLENSEATLKEKEAEVKAAETALKEKKAALESSIAALKEKETSLNASVAALKEQAEALKEAAAAQEESSAPAPEESEPIPEESAPVTEETAPVPEESTPAPEESAITTEESTPVLEESVPTPEENEPDPEEELVLVEKEIALSEKEIVLTKNEIKIAEKEIEILNKEIEIAEKNSALAAEESPLLAKEIALKKNEIEQMKTLQRQDKELRALELNNKQKELSELDVSINDNVIRAPFAGRIVYGDTLVPGSWVNAEDPVVFLADDSRFTVVCGNISDTVINRSSHIFAKIGDKEYQLEYIPIDPDEYTKMMLLGEEINTRFEIVATETELAQLEVGQYAAICMWRDYVPDALLVPSNAVQSDAGGKYVYVEENGSRVKRTVKTGLETDSITQILEGLKEGDVVYVKE